MNENVWDPVMAWQALLPGSVTECPEKLPEINLLVPELLTATSLSGAGVTAASWTLAKARELSISGFTLGYSCDKTLRTQQASKSLSPLSTFYLCQSGKK